MSTRSFSSNLGEFLDFSRCICVGREAKRGKRERDNSGDQESKKKREEESKSGRVDSFGFKVLPNFISDAEHDSLLKDANSFLAKKPFLNDHFDGVITGYREGLMNLSKEGPQNDNLVELSKLSKRVYSHFPKTSSPLMPSVHFIELQKNGSIGKHVDSIKFSGSVVAGISLQSDCVMHLYPVNIGSDGGENIHSFPLVDVYIPKKSLYIMSDEARYHWAHSIPSGEPTFLTKSVPRERRVSMIFRNVLEPSYPSGAVSFKGSFAEKVFMNNDTV